MISGNLGDWQITGNLHEHFCTVPHPVNGRQRAGLGNPTPDIDKAGKVRLKLVGYTEMPVLEEIIKTLIEEK